MCVYLGDLYLARWGGRKREKNDWAKREKSERGERGRSDDGEMWKETYLLLLR